MTKRSLASAPSTPRKKRAKAADDQLNLDAFFRKDDSGVSSSPENRSKHVRRATRSAIAAESGIPLGEGDIRGEPVAMASPAAQEGDSGVGRPHIPTAAGGLAANGRSSTVHIPEVIDVDLLDDFQSPGAGSSTSGQSKDLSSGSFAADPTVSGSRSTFGRVEAQAPPQYLSLSVDPTDYSCDSPPWPANSAAPYSFLAHTLCTLSGTRSRIAILNTLTNALRTIIQYHPASLCPALYLLSNTLSPPYLPIELGLGPSIISKAIQDVSGLTSAALKRLYNATGDPGDVAFEAKSNVRTLFPHPPLLVTGVYQSLLKIANAKGSGAAKQKQGIVEKLLVAAKGEETRYLVRTLGQNLRVGAVRTSMLTALARAVVLTPPSGIEAPSNSPLYASAELQANIKPRIAKAKQKIVDSAREQLNDKFSRAEAIIKKAYVQHPNYEHIAAALLEVGLHGLPDKLPLTVGIPLLPTLGSPTRSLDEIYERLGELPFSAEFKYDGQRAQIHAARANAAQASVKIFSRHLEDMTDKYPDVVSLVRDIFANSAETQSFIIDAEIVAIDTDDGSLRSFQELSNRARRDVKLDDVTVAVSVFAFDLMYLDREILIEKPFRHRRSLLRSRFPPLIPAQKGAARFDHVQSCESEEGRDAVEEFWQAAVKSRSEGLMIKLLDSGEVLETSEKTSKSRRKPLPATYEPDKRTSAWLKLKKDYVIGLGDSLDLVPIGAWHGNGRKAQWWSPILLAVWDPDLGKLVAVCKCMSGFSDVFYKTLRERYPEDSETCSRRPLWAAECETGGLRPEVYFKPQEVWEIRGADITISPVSVAALGRVSDKRGLSLRFPRFIQVREDKGIDNASTPDFLANMYRSQQGKGEQRGGVDDGDLVDVSMEESDAEEEEDVSERENTGPTTQ